MVFFRRKIQQKIENSLFKRKVVVLYGARQVGKTTLIKDIAQKYPEDSVYLNCEEPDIQIAFTHATSSAMKAFIGEKRMVFLDEAQRVSDIGISLKILVDTYPDMQIVATGSSSFELANKIVEPLTGRKEEFFLPPLSLEEMVDTEGNMIEAQRTLERRLIDGMYPYMVTAGAAEARLRLKELTRSYLYQDILQHQKIQHPAVLEQLLRALAFQIGSEVSYSEIGTMVGLNNKTVERYIDLLEKTFVIFRLPPFSRNLRKEIAKSRKIYFFDNGIRNSLINNFTAPALRQDMGALWENFAISERQKFLLNHQQFSNCYFWRTYDGQEIDYIEEADGAFFAFEMKWKNKKYRFPSIFLEQYHPKETKIVSSEDVSWLSGRS